MLDYKYMAVHKRICGTHYLLYHIGSDQGIYAYPAIPNSKYLPKYAYCKVANRSMSCLVAPQGIFRLLMQWKFDVYFWQKIDFAIAARSTVRPECTRHGTPLAWDKARFTHSDPMVPRI